MLLTPGSVLSFPRIVSMKDKFYERARRGEGMALCYLMKHGNAANKKEPQNLFKLLELN